MSWQLVIDPDRSTDLMVQRRSFHRWLLAVGCGLVLATLFLRVKDMPIDHPTLIREIPDHVLVATPYLLVVLFAALAFLPGPRALAFVLQALRALAAGVFATGAWMMWRCAVENVLVVGLVAFLCTTWLAVRMFAGTRDERGLASLTMLFGAVELLAFLVFMACGSMPAAVLCVAGGTCTMVGSKLWMIEVARRPAQLSATATVR